MAGRVRVSGEDKDRVADAVHRMNAAIEDLAVAEQALREIVSSWATSLTRGSVDAERPPVRFVAAAAIERLALLRTQRIHRALGVR